MSKQFKEDVMRKDNEVKEFPKKEEIKKTQKFKVLSIVNEKSVMTEGMNDKLLYSKPNKKYKIGQIID